MIILIEVPGIVRFMETETRKAGAGEKWKWRVPDFNEGGVSTYKWRQIEVIVLQP